MNNRDVRDPAVAALLFQPVQLTRARELRCLTKTALAAMVDKTPSAISQFESQSSNVRPDDRTLARLALALAVPVGFFARAPMVGRVALDDCHFRSMRSVGQAQRRQALRVGELLQELARILEDEGIRLPEDRVTPLRQSVRTPDEIERLAYAVREDWGLGLGPIPSVIPLLEANGVRVFPLTSVCAGVDAFSTWYDQTPLAMLVLSKPASRVHFDGAHELGHLLMHEDVVPADPQTEKEANLFASAFLLPRKTFIAECPDRWSLRTFIALKKRWHVSVQALVYRAHQLGKLSTASYRRAFAELNRKKLRQHEGGEWQLHRPSALRKGIDLLGEEISHRELASRLALHESHLAELLSPIVGS